MTEKNKMNLLIIDDEPAVLNSLNALFRKKYNVTTFDSAEKALEVVVDDTHTFPLILVDQKMPGMQGYEFLDILKKKKIDTLNILITGYSDIESLVKSINDGKLFGYVAKPWDPEALQEMVARAEEYFNMKAENVILTKELKKINEELELRVKKRTAELMETNGQLQKEIAERKKSEEEARIAKEEAQAANKAKSDFLSNMSHEIRTPMNAIMGFTQLALREDIAPKPKDYLCRIQTASDTLLQLINDILDLSKIEAGRLTLESVNFILDEVLEVIRLIISVSSNKKGLNFIIKKTDDVPVRLIGDPTRLRQVLINLANNAVKFTECGEISISVKGLEQDENSTKLCFEVKDTGIGIPEDLKSRLFKPFMQADSSTTRKYGGTGLGLSISKKIVEMMGGDIEVKSDLGKGSVFSFTACFGLDNKYKGKKNISIDILKEQFSPELKELLSKTKALVVEDSLFNQMVAQGILEGYGISVEIAVDGKDAIEKISHNFYDVIFMDMQMPRMDGIEATKFIRSTLKLTEIPIIAMTANIFAKERQECLDAGMNDHIAKPFKHEHVINTLLRWIGKHD